MEILSISEFSNERDEAYFTRKKFPYFRVTPKQGLMAFSAQAEDDYLKIGTDDEVKYIKLITANIPGGKMHGIVFLKKPVGEIGKDCIEIKNYLLSKDKNPFVQYRISSTKLIKDFVKANNISILNPMSSMLILVSPYDKYGNVIKQLNVNNEPHNINWLYYIEPFVGDNFDKEHALKTITPQYAVMVKDIMDYHIQSNTKTE